MLCSAVRFAPLINVELLLELLELLKAIIDPERRSAQATPLITRGRSCASAQLNAALLSYCSVRSSPGRRSPLPLPAVLSSVSVVLRVARMGLGAALTVDLRACHAHLYHGLWGLMEGAWSAAEQRRCVLLALRCVEELLLDTRCPSIERVAAFVHRLLLLAAHLTCAPQALAVLGVVERLLAAYPALRSLCDDGSVAAGRFLPLLDDCDASNARAQGFSLLTALQWSSDAAVVAAVRRIAQPNPTAPVDRALTAARICGAAEQRAHRFPLPPPASLTARLSAGGSRTRHRSGKSAVPSQSSLGSSDFLSSVQQAHARTRALAQEQTLHDSSI